MTESAATTHPGLKRSHNEDSYASDPDLGLWLVADGVGGHASGEVASAIVRDTLHSGFARGRDLVDAICDAHEAVLEDMATAENRAGMGSTVVALSLQDQQYDVAWVGDSRAYLWDGKLHQLTRDHSQVGLLVAKGIVSPQQAATHPKRHVLTQSVGISNTMRLAPERIVGELSSGQQILLCSDGLTDELNDATIAKHMARCPTAQAQVDALLSEALAAGGRDNITIVVICAPAKTRPTSLEDTQITTRISSVQKSKRINHATHVWAIVAVMVALALATWLVF
ncbi:MAG: serine/threonine-protein phosphatase [Halieaceae bacterium]|jgi:PPM family protein phosphatase|nr:serine/threonine-protein phosphatase [Halieaceae bacterium]